MIKENEKKKERSSRPILKNKPLDKSEKGRISRVENRKMVRRRQNAAAEKAMFQDLTQDLLNDYDSLKKTQEDL